MNLYLMLAIVIANVIAIGIVYQFIKKLKNKQKIITIAISVAIMYVLISITYWISGFGINKTIHEATKKFITYLFVPVNMILFVPYILAQYMKLKLKQTKLESFLKKLIIVSILLLIVLGVEYSYFRYIQNNINLIGNSIQENNIVNEENVQENEIETNEIETNETIINEIVNEVMENEIE